MIRFYIKFVGSAQDVSALAIVTATNFVMCPILFIKIRAMLADTGLQVGSGADIIFFKVWIGEMSIGYGSALTRGMDKGVFSNEDSHMVYFLAARLSEKYKICRL